MPKRFSRRGSEKRKKGFPRFPIISFFILLLFGLVFFRLSDLTFFKRPRLLEVARKQNVIVIKLEPKRGKILDRKGKKFATTIKTLSVYAMPRLISEQTRSELAEALAEVLNLKPDWVEARLKRNKAFIWIKRKVTDQEVELVRRIGHPAIGLQPEYKRFYPHSQELAHVLGFCNIDNEGLEGLELAYNAYLQGEYGRRYSRRDAFGREIPVFEERMISPRNGCDLVLNIDQFIQHLVERELDAAFVQWKAKGACAVVMAPKTGAILAMASRPVFNPNDGKMPVEDAIRNRAITDIYEPGSIFKVITISAALNENKVTPEDTFFCENGTWHASRKRVVHDVHPYGQLTVAGVLLKSSNIGTCKIAKVLGEKSLYQYIKMFGFGESTGVDLRGEVPGIVHPLNRWSGFSITAVPFGQEVAATALQMVRAMSVVANGGYLVKPQIVRELRDEYGVMIKNFPHPDGEKILTDETASRMQEMLVRVVEEGTGKTARIEGVKVAGKTGTSQKLNPGGGYSHSNFIGSFMGFAPADRPALCMVVMLDDPKPLYYGGTVAAPVFQKVMKEALFYLERTGSPLLPPPVPTAEPEVAAEGAVPVSPAA